MQQVLDRKLKLAEQPIQRVVEDGIGAVNQFAIAGPAILTNLSNPIANAIFAGVVARFGDTAVAALAIMDRLVPVAFGVLFALSGAVGPILGQNWGAGRFDRMRQGLTDAAIFAGISVLVSWVLLFAFRGAIVSAFHAPARLADRQAGCSSLRPPD